MAELHHECGIAALYHYAEDRTSPIVQEIGRGRVSRLVPSMLIDIQNRGQLAAGMTTFKPFQNELLVTHKQVGSVSEVFRMSRKEKYNKLMEEHTGPAAIGHVRYATCGRDDPSYAQPFERTHLEKKKWFSFAFNGQLANYADLRNEIRSQGDFHLARETDTETLMHLISQEISQNPQIAIRDLLAKVSTRLDGAYNIVFLNSTGQMFVARDPHGFRPLCYAERDGFFAAASESVALTNLGFDPTDVRDLDPGCAVVIEDGKMRIERFAPAPRYSHCFFEWIYFANVCSRLDDQSVYLSRKSLGEELAAQERESTENAIVVPVPDTAKAAAEGMAFNMKVPCLEGLMRHRALGRTFIESEDREAKARRKYIPLPEVLQGKRVFLVDDTIVRSTTMKVLIEQIKVRGGAEEVHVRVACPPIMAPCFYGIDMPDVDDLFAPSYLKLGEPITPELEAEMAAAFGADSLRYLPVESIAKALNKDSGQLCQACLTGEYPTEAGTKLYQISLQNVGKKQGGKRLVEEETSCSLPPARL
ncbi:MAG: amidophosphoribosyltransferase [Planctomycetaceae bacterium]|nr:amidophosphoribosyltransferase [Planctomycetaceae bacterium]